MSAVGRSTSVSIGDDESANVEIGDSLAHDARVDIQGPERVYTYWVTSDERALFATEYNEVDEDAVPPWVDHVLDHIGLAR